MQPINKGGPSQQAQPRSVLPPASGSNTRSSKVNQVGRKSLVSRIIAFGRALRDKVFKPKQATQSGTTQNSGVDIKHQLANLGNLLSHVEGGMHYEKRGVYRYVSRLMMANDQINSLREKINGTKTLSSRERNTLLKELDALQGRSSAMKVRLRHRYERQVSRAPEGPNTLMYLRGIAVNYLTSDHENPDNVALRETVAQYTPTHNFAKCSPTTKKLIVKFRYDNETSIGTAQSRISTLDQERKSILGEILDNNASISSLAHIVRRIDADITEHKKFIEANTVFTPDQKNALLTSLERLRKDHKKLMADCPKGYDSIPVRGHTGKLDALPTHDETHVNSNGMSSGYEEVSDPLASPDSRADAPFRSIANADERARNVADRIIQGLSAPVPRRIVPPIHDDDLDDDGDYESVDMSQPL